MNKDFLSLTTNVTQEVQDTSANMQTIAKRYLNRRYFMVLRKINWEAIRQGYTFDTTAGTQDYVLPDDWGKPLYIVDSTNDVELEETDLQRLVRDNVTLRDATGGLSKYAIYEDRVQAQPSAAGTLTIVSSSASDTTQTVTVRGLDSNGREIVETNTLTGTSNVTTTASFSIVKFVSKSATTTGTITVSASGTTLATLAPSLLESRYKLIRFIGVPNGTISIEAPYIIKPMPMVQDNDYPLIDIADLIEVGAIADAWGYKKQFGKRASANTMFEKMLIDYIWDKENHPNKITQFEPAAFNRNDLY